MKSDDHMIAAPGAVVHGDAALVDFVIQDRKPDRSPALSMSRL